MSPILGIYASQMSGHLWPASSYESISTTTVGAGGVSSVTFSSIPSTYTHLQIRGIARANTGGNTNTVGLDMQFNSDTGANYSTSHVLYGTGSSALAAASAASQTNGTAVNYTGSAQTASVFGVFVIDILDYANTNKYKTIRGLGGSDSNDTNGIVTFRSFAWMSTSAISSITLGITKDLAQYSSLALYGIKGVA
jgi:hypothetical protein